VIRAKQRQLHSQSICEQQSIYLIICELRYYPSMHIFITSFISSCITPSHPSLRYCPVPMPVDKDTPVQMRKLSKTFATTPALMTMARCRGGRFWMRSGSSSVRTISPDSSSYSACAVGKSAWMDGWINGWMGRWMDGSMNGWINGWLDG